MTMTANAHSNKSVSGDDHDLTSREDPSIPGVLGPTAGGEPDAVSDRTGAAAELRARALQRLKKKADFRNHLLIYCLVNGMLLIIWAVTSAGGFFWPVFAMAGWGIGLVANYYDAYVKQEPTEAQVAAEVERLRDR